MYSISKKHLCLAAFVLALSFGKFSAAQDYENSQEIIYYDCDSSDWAEKIKQNSDELDSGNKKPIDQDNSDSKPLPVEQKFEDSDNWSEEQFGQEINESRAEYTELFDGVYDDSREEEIVPKGDDLEGDRGRSDSYIENKDRDRVQAQKHDELDGSSRHPSAGDKCITGRYECLYSDPKKFLQCDHGHFIVMNCGPGTRCVSDGEGYIFCA
ncbi:hypothetical protein AYI68_g6632 [Smittium mucronatum]|uniref:Carbohydrate-binding module family 19 domain-containing protein n=1 Tax=Smittium mucronatum TaxID=133383 RepID=A0A1R0GQX7_9FUNG|nr:hypothetical protein AYI68_g6632 [Smittium mucronatum]